MQSADKSDNNTLVALRDSLRTEAKSLRDRYERQWEQNAGFYRGNQWGASKAPEGHEQYIVNLTQNAVIASAAIQTEQRPRINIVARETDDPPTYYLKEGAVEPLLGAGLPIQLTPEQIAGTEPVDESVVQALTPLMQPEIDELTGQETAPAMLQEDAIIAINDQVVADTLKLVIQTMWDNAGMDFVLLQNVLNCGIVGHQPMLVQWDAEKNKPEFCNVHQFNVWIDPISTGIEDADYAIFDEVISADKAKMLYPEFADVIDTNSASGQSLHAEFRRQSLELGGPYYQTEFNRAMVTVSTLWQRYQQLPMSEEEAVAEKLAAPQMELVPVDPEAPVAEPVEGEPQEPVEPEERQSVNEDGLPLYINEGGESMTPESENWPTKRVTLQVRFIGDTVIDVRECPYADIPIGWNINIPQPHSPYGQGEPERLESLQKIINRLLSVFGNHVKYYQFPTEAMSQSMYEATKKSGQATHSQASRITIIPDDQWQMSGGKVSTKDDVPAIPSSYVQLYNNLVETFSRLSGNQDVLQGVSPGADTSAEAIKTLQSAARGPIGFKSTYTERMLAHIVKLMIGMSMDFLPESEWVKIVSKYPVQVLLAIRDRAKVVEYDTSVDVVSGKGSIRAQKEQQAMTLAQMGQIDNLSLLEHLEWPNAKQTNQQVMAERAMVAPVQQGSPPKN